MYRYLEIKTAILDEIRGLQADTRIPARAEYCRRFMTTRTTVDRAIRELISAGTLYAINGSGTYVARNKPVSVGRLWGVVMPDLTYDVYAQILRGISDAIDGSGISLRLCNTDFNVERQHTLVEQLVHDGAEGAIIVPPISDRVEMETYRLLERAKIPYVFCNRYVEQLDGAPLVCINNQHGGYLATQHLIERGYRNIAFISSLRYQLMIDRYAGYVSAHLENNLEIHRRYVAQGNARLGQPSTYENGEFLRENIVRLLTQYPEIDAMFCPGEHEVSHVYDAIRACGRRIGEDFGLVTHDNSPVCEMMRPRLTAVSYNGHQVGYQAAQILMRGDDERESWGVYVIHPELVIRESSAHTITPSRSISLITPKGMPEISINR